MSRSATRFLLIATAAFASRVATADSTTIYPQADNTLYEDPTGSLSNGHGFGMFSGRTGQLENAKRRALVSFPVIEFVPFGSQINSVELRLYVSQTHGSLVPVSIHRVLESWAAAGSNANGGPNGGGQGAPAEPWDATWIHRFFDHTNWSTPGGVFVATPSATQTVGSIGYYYWGSTPEMVADVQLWAQDHSQNFGWIIIGDEETAGSAKRFSTMEDTFELIPVLTINFTPIRNCSSEEPWNPCDTDCNGSINAFDIQPFIELLSNPGSQGCSTCAGDTNQNGTVNAFDINDFIVCLMG